MLLALVIVGIILSRVQGTVVEGLYQGYIGGVSLAQNMLLVLLIRFFAGVCRHYFASGAVVQWWRDINRAKRGVGCIGGASLVQNMLLLF